MEGCGAVECSVPSLYMFGEVGGVACAFHLDQFACGRLDGGGLEICYDIMTPSVLSLLLIVFLYYAS